MAWNWRAGVERLAAGLARSRGGLWDRLRDLFAGGRLDAEALARIEETLLAADCGVTAAEGIVEALRGAARAADAPADLRGLLRAEILKRLPPGGDIRWAPAGPTVALVAGVNGTGKTTTVAKLARRYHAAGKKVVVAAADTFRAAAVEQLAIWCARADVPCVRHQGGGDPAAVVFDAAQAAAARGADLLLVDTAGRLHTYGHLMKELEKISRVVAKTVPGAPHEVLLVLDATAGQNALAQARAFQEAIGVTGVVLAKMDGTARGGVAVAIADALGIPVRFVGTGEGMDDLAPFDPEVYAEGLLGDATAPA